MDYDLKPLGRTCSATGRPLRPGETCRSALVRRGGDVVRLDFAPEAWTGPPPDAIGHWSSIVPPPVEQKSRTLDPDRLLQVFEQLCEDADPSQDASRYVLGLLLMQKRRLRLDDTHDDSGTLRFVGLQGEGPYDVPEQSLSAADVERLQTELDLRLTERAA